MDETLDSHHEAENVPNMSEAESRASPKQAPGQANEAPPTAASSTRSLSQEASNSPAAQQDPTSAEDSTEKAAATSDAMRVSANASVKDDEPAAVGPSPYGTRSRQKSNITRPNYADDDDLDLEIEMAGIRHGESNRRSISSDLPLKLEVVNGTARGHTSLGGSHAIEHANGASPPNHHAQPSDTENSSTKAAQKPEKKRKQHDKDASAKSTPGADFIPGTSTFSAAPAADGQPSKRRKLSPNSTAGQRSQYSSRKSTLPATRPAARETCVYSFEKSRALLRDGKLIADDGTVFAPNDTVYLICEPPGDPYYLCRIMEFRHVEVDNSTTPVVSMLVNWFYRPKDIGRYNADPRYLYASMQSDESPITSLRGKCHIMHRSEIDDLEEFRKARDTFWFNQLYDRYIHRPYEMVPVSQVINVPEKVKKALDERWKFLVVEPARLKELTSAVKLCKRCSGYCASNDSVECAVCHKTYHMTCVRPVLQKKPSRGFGWSCGPCSKAQERRLKERHTAVIPSPTSAEHEEEEEIIEEDEDDPAIVTTAPSPHEDEAQDQHPVTQAEIAQANMWPWRYLGIHCRVEDVLQYDDRAIYPRASSRLGPRHQANVAVWHGQPVELVKPAEIKRRYVKSGGNKKNAVLSKETIAAIEADRSERAKRPKWVQDEPPGYIARGEDLPDSDPKNTAQRLFVIPEAEEMDDSVLDDYMTEVRKLSESNNDMVPIEINEDMVKVKVKFGHAAKDIPKVGDAKWTTTTNFIDNALSLLQENNFEVDAALDQLYDVTPKSIGNPDFSKEETKKFEDGVAKYGSDLRSVRKYVKTRPHGQIVRFYYGWKRKPRGREVWEKFEGKGRGKRRVEASWTEIADDEDDSAFDNEKSVARKRFFQCKHCATRSSRQWRRAPNVAAGATILADPKGSAKDRANQLVLALCQRCAILWRRYGLKWEDPEEIARTIAASGGRAWKRKTEEEMLREVLAANEEALVPTGPLAASAGQAIGITLQVPLLQDPKKKIKGAQEKEGTPMSSSTESQQKKKGAQVPLRPTTPPVVPQSPKLRNFPCAICLEMEPSGAQQLLTCKECRLSVHRQCYGVLENASANKWICDLCLNEKNGQGSIAYECILCPVNDRKPDLLEPPKQTHKKKSERDKEKEKLEKELSVDFLKAYAKEQEEKGRPNYPREPLKRTTCNNWVHVSCAVWTPEIKFSQANMLEAAEGMGALINMPNRLDPMCKICRKTQGVCVSCYHTGCPSRFHVECAHDAGYVLGFDVHPVKGSRKDTINSVTVGTETGSMSAAIWCVDHQQIKSIVHPMHEIVDETGMNALQLYAQTFKQADLTLTGTARKANLLNQTAKVPTGLLGARRNSMLTNGSITALKRARVPSGDGAKDETVELEEDFGKADSVQRVCVSCKNDTSPRWHALPTAFGPTEIPGSRQINGEHPLIPQPNGYPVHFDQTPSNTTAIRQNPISAPVRWKCHGCFVKKVETPTPKYGPIPADTRAPSKEFQPRVEYGPIPGPALLQQPPPSSQYPPPVHSVPLLPSAAVPQATSVSTTDHPPVGPPGHHPGKDPRSESDWTSNLDRTSIWLHRGDIQQHLRVKDFGNLNDNQQLIFNHFQKRAAEILSYDQRLFSIRTNNDIEINSPAALIDALVQLVLHGPREVHWYIVEKDMYAPYQVNGHPHPRLPSHSPATHQRPLRVQSPPRPHYARPGSYGPPDTTGYPPPSMYPSHPLPPYPHYVPADRGQHPPPHSRPPIPPPEPPIARSPRYGPYVPPPLAPPHPSPHSVPQQLPPPPPPPQPMQPRSQYPMDVSGPPTAPYYDRGSALQLTEPFAPAHAPRSYPPVPPPGPIHQREGPGVRDVAPRDALSPPQHVQGPLPSPTAAAPGHRTPLLPPVSAVAAAAATVAGGASSSPSLRNLVH